MDLLWVIGGMLGLDGMAPSDPTATLAKLCSDGVALACDASWRTSQGAPDLPALQAAAKPRCDAGDLAACGALGIAVTRTPIGGLARTASAWETGLTALDRACEGGVARACTERARIAMFVDPATDPTSIDPAPHRTLAGLCEIGEPVACLLAGDVLANGWTGAVDTAGAKAAWGKACEAGVPDGCARVYGTLDAARMEETCERGDARPCWIMARDETRTPLRRLDAMIRACEAADSTCPGVNELLRDPKAGLTTTALATACSGGDGAACHGAGWLGLRGLTNAAAVDAAVGAFQAGCEAGYAPSCRQVGELALQGLVRGSTETTALADLDRACGAGSWRACLTVARVARGRGAGDVAAAFEVVARSLAGVPYVRLDPKASGGTTPLIGGSAETGRTVVAWTAVEAKSRVSPEFPELARKAGVDAAECPLRVWLDADGSPRSVSALACHPLFVGSAEAALLKWRFTATKAAPPLEFDMVVKYRLQ